MPDVNFTDKIDVYDQSLLPARDNWDWANYFFGAGDDIARVYTGVVLGGPGNDTIEKIIDPNKTYYQVAIGYWDSPKGIKVDLAAGTAQDGWGTTDTLKGGIDFVYGNQFDDLIVGDDRNNRFASGGGHDVIDGGGGIDIVELPWKKGDAPDLRAYNITVALDGLSATITSSAFPGLQYDIRNVQKLVRWNTDGTVWLYWDLASFIKPNDMAQQGLTGADSQRWNAGNAHGTAVTVSYSFVSNAPSSGVGVAGFRAFTDAEKAVVRNILASTSAITGISLNEVADNGSTAGQIRFGVSQQATTKGTSFLPDVNPANASAGDVWMDVESMLNLSVGSEGYQALLHEIGHALGLRHPRNVDPGEAWAQQWRGQDDITANTVMSGTSSADGLFRADWGPMDVAALRYLYGTKAVNMGDTFYRVGGADAQAQRALVDDGGSDTIDARDSQVGVSLDLTSGHRSSVGLTADGKAATGNLEIAVGTQIENAAGSNHDDVILGNELNNRLDGGQGNDWIDGAAGADTAVFAGQRNAFTVSTGFGKVFVAANDGVSGFTTLLNVEKLAFADGTIDLAPTLLSADINVTLDQNTVTTGQLPTPTDQSRTGLSYSIMAKPLHGELVADGSGNYTYVPQTGFVGVDSLSYTLSDGKGASNVYAAYFNVLAAAPDLMPKNLVGTASDDVFVGAGGNDTLTGSVGNDLLVGHDGDDFLDGGDGVDTIVGGGGNDKIVGGIGNDTAVYAGKSTDYLIRYDSISSTYSVKDGVSSRDGTDKLTSVELLQFSDGVKQLATSDALLVSRVHQALYGKAQGSAVFNESLAKVSPSGSTLDWVKAEASGLSALSDSAFTTLVLNNMSINNTSLTATTAFGTAQQAYDTLQQAMTGYLGVVGSANRGIVTAQVATIIAGFEGETIYGVYGAAATAFNRQVATDLAHNINTQNTSEIVAVPVFTSGTVSAASGNFEYMLAMGNYGYQVSGFGSGDRIFGPTGVSGTLSNTDSGDGTATIQYISGSQTVNITMTGLTTTQDGALHLMNDLNTVFGIGTLL